KNDSNVASPPAEAPMPTTRPTSRGRAAPGSWTLAAALTAARRRRPVLVLPRPIFYRRWRRDRYRRSLLGVNAELRAGEAEPSPLMDGLWHASHHARGRRCSP